MLLSEWREWRRAITAYPGQGTFSGIIYCALGLGEAGECIGEIKKMWRDDGLSVSPERREKILYEMGDVLWYLDALANELGSSLEEIMGLNVSKINARRAQKAPVG